MDNLVARIVAAGMTSAIFTYFLVQLVVKPALARRGDQWWHALATNGLALLIAIVAAFGLTLLLVDEFTYKVAVEAIFTGVIAAATATYGHEVVSNYGQRNITNVAGDSISIDELSGSGIVVGDESSARVSGDK